MSNSKTKQFSIQYTRVTSPKSSRPLSSASPKQSISISQHKMLHYSRDDQKFGLRSDFYPPPSRHTLPYEKSFEYSSGAEAAYHCHPPPRNDLPYYNQDRTHDASFPPDVVIPNDHQYTNMLHPPPPQQGVASWDLETKDSISSHSVTSSEAKRKAGCTVDHTYRDFSGVPPSNEDFERYENKKKEYDRRVQAKNGSTNEPQVTPEPSENTDSELPKKGKKKRGRGNKAKKGNDSFVGFMGTNFPARLHDLLSHENGIGDIITWLPHGRSWIVRDKKEFLERVAPSHFQITKFESFTRQVNGWGFKRITQGPDINSYYHELFLRRMPHLIQWMKRVSSSGQGRRKIRADPKDEPNFYEIGRSYPIPDYYNDNSGDTAEPESSTVYRQITPVYDNSGRQERNRRHSNVSENRDPRIYHDFNNSSSNPNPERNHRHPHNRENDFSVIDDSPFRARERFFLKDNSNEHVLQDMNIDDFWTDVPYEHRQSQRGAPGPDQGCSHDPNLSSPRQDIHPVCTFKEPVATKNHWRCFYDALVDSGDKDGPTNQQEDLVEDFEEPAFIQDITPVPIHYPLHSHRPDPSSHNHNYDCWDNRNQGHYPGTKYAGDAYLYSDERGPKKVKVEEQRELNEHDTDEFDYPEPSVVTYV